MFQIGWFYFRKIIFNVFMSESFQRWGIFCMEIFLERGRGGGRIRNKMVNNNSIQQLIKSRRLEKKLMLKKIFFCHSWNLVLSILMKLRIVSSYVIICERRMLKAAFKLKSRVTYVFYNKLWPWLIDLLCFFAIFFCERVSIISFNFMDFCS